MVKYTNTATEITLWNTAQKDSCFWQMVPCLLRFQYENCLAYILDDWGLE